MFSGFTLTNGATASSGDYGGGVWFQPPATAVISNCVLTGNAASTGGGGSYGGKAVSCVFSNNSSRGDGGGAFYTVLVNCILKSNVAGVYGGGALTTWLTNCLLVGNSAGTSGGGTYSASLVNCTVVSNSIFGTGFGKTGGGVIDGRILNCILLFNNAPVGSNYYGSGLSYCCTVPMDPGDGNITNSPLFVDPANGDYHLQGTSPCINAGQNSNIKSLSDLDGNPRIAGATVDMGAYEFQAPASAISYYWLQYFGLPTDGSADYLDTDGDGMNNWQEWICGTDPTNSASVLRMHALTRVSSGMTVSWDSVTNRTYFLQRAVNLNAVGSFVTITTKAGQFGTTTFTDTNAATAGPLFYRVGCSR